MDLFCAISQLTQKHYVNQGVVDVGKKNEKRNASVVITTSIFEVCALTSELKASAE